MDVRDVIKRIGTVPITEKAVITQLKHAEDNEPYQVWKIDTDSASYILKEAKEDEAEIYQSILSALNEDYAPVIYETIAYEEKIFLLIEHIAGEDLCKCNRKKLILALDALIALQKKTWENQSFASFGYSFNKSLFSRQQRGKYLNDPLLAEVYEKFLQIYYTVPRTLCHDDLLPFNIIASDKRAVLIDWECGGILPYPTSFARLIAHTEGTENALFFMTEEDRAYAIDYYYDNLLKGLGISYASWRKTLAYFLFYEYCEWVFIGHKYHATDGAYYKKYLPIAKQHANKIKLMEQHCFEISREKGIP